MGKILFYRIVSTFHKEKSYKRVEGGGIFRKENWKTKL